MTKQELNMILKLIDMRTTEEETYRDCFSKQINESDIEALKQDIKEIFDGEN